MKKRLRQKIGIFFAAIFLLALVEEVPAHMAEWILSEKKDALVVVDLKRHLSERQRRLIESGFTTFSMLEIRRTPERPDPPKDDHIANAANLPFRISCSVVYDTWQERYEVARIDDTIASSVVKTFDEYSNLCLRGKLGNKDLPERAAQHGGKMYAHLQINQVSQAKALEIKQWLIRQQTGVMQGLFAHMLGDLKVSEQISVDVTVPPQGKKNVVAKPEGKAK